MADGDPATPAGPGGSAPARVRRNRDAEVIAAAVKVFAQKGYAEASIQDLADEVGVLKGSIYYYIDSKEGLLRRIFDDAHEQATAIIAEATALDVPPLERLRSYFEIHVRWYLDNVEQARVFFREFESLTGEHHEVVRQRRRGYERFIEQLIDDCREADEVGPNATTRHALLYVLGAINAAPQWYRRDKDDAAETAAAYADLTVGTLTGVRSRGGATGPAAP